MAPKEQAGFRADPTLIARVDAFAAQFAAEHPGLDVTRSDAIVMLLTEALNARGIEAPAERPARAAPSKPRAKKGAKAKARKP